MPPEEIRIRILPESVANKIAAGEVVERPASVVKELVENSLDAGARVIRVEVEAGGRKLVRVTDDGRGMTPDEALLAIERHATSKIRTEADLFSVSTMGFRGEALPSIAAVSRFELLTRVMGRDEGVRVRVEGATVKDVEPAGCAPGTVVTVRDLFFNVPARRKFMRSKNTEMANISEMMSKIAIAHPEVHFQLSHGGRDVIEAPPAGELQARLADALGKSVLDSMVQLEHEGPRGVSLHGFVILPELSRSNASHMYVYVNRRPVRNRTVQHAIIEAYRGILPKGRYPVVALFIELDPSEVDVNVHPAKAEVRFRDSGLVHEAVRSAVLSAFERRETQPKPHHPGPQVSPREMESRIMTALKRSVGAVPHQESYGRNTRGKEAPPMERGGEAPTEPESRGKKPPLKPVTSPRPWGYFSELKILGQLRATFIVCQSPEGLLLIDQHAAHERIAFEQLRGQYSQERVKRQSLLFPEIIELSLKESSEMERHTETLNMLGFDIESFGERTWRVTSLPAVLSSSDPRALVMDVLESLSSHAAASLGDLVDDVFARMACHAVVRASHILTDDEMRALLDSLDEADYPLTCPHGRPICVHITFEELEKMFKRR